MREWIVTNGLGGYASLTYKNSVTRKFHGLLVSSLRPPVDRWVFVSHIQDFIQMKDNRYIHIPENAGAFSFDFLPSFSYQFDTVRIKKTIWMPYQQNTTIIRYDVTANQPLTMMHQPIITCRHFYDVNSYDHAFSLLQKAASDGVLIRFSNNNNFLRILLRDAFYQPEESWIELQYQTDKERNDSYKDHVVRIGKFQKTLQTSSTYYIILTIENHFFVDPEHSYQEEIKRRQHLLKKANLPERFHKLVLSTDNFIVKRGNKKSVIAGYHWFGDWGRDTLISLPGLTLVTGRYHIAKHILDGLKNFCQKGLIPNMFDDRRGMPVYNTVDASLWYIDRVFQYLKYTNDFLFIRSLWETLESIITHYKNGTDYGIHMDGDYLISHDPGLTWMDVKLGEMYSTPRARKAVEIQALWYNALEIMSRLAQIIGKKDWYHPLSENVKEQFIMQFDQRYDVIDTGDTSFRPNQIFLVSLDFPMINKKLQEKIVADIQDQLLTIFGLRTLSPLDPHYKGKYIGSYPRDLAYHNGTVWPWLLGPFITSFVKTHGYKKRWRRYAYEEFLHPMFHVFGMKWDGSINEIFDGDPPYIPRGCITQAWSVAEVLRAWVEDIEMIRPVYERLYENVLLNKIGV